ncbi:MAG: hypothetical protein J5534_00325 [Fibrobacter sp.]|nr:hypothetical protein [Fibrobacter sp.]
MSIKLKKYAAVAAFSFVSMLAFNACGEDSEGPQGPAGEQGVAGKNGENGTSCSAKALDDDSGYELTCGGKVVGTIKNGTNGVNGVNGSSCTAKALTDKSGFELSCDGEVVGVIKNGSNGANGINGTNGENGTSCSAKALDDGSGYELTCGGKPIGTIKNGSKGDIGTSCTAKELDGDAGYELICGGKSVGTIKNGNDGQNGTNCSAKALEDESGFELTCGKEVVGTIKNGTNGGNGKSCSATALEDGSGFELKCGGKSVGVIKNGKDVEKVRGTGFDAWYYGKNTADENSYTDDRVVTDALQGSEDEAGFWYADLYGQTTALWGPDYKTKTVLDCSSEPCQTIVNGDFEHVAEIIDENGIFVEVSQNQADRVNEDEWQGFNLGVNFTADEENGADVSHWRGLCLKYTVDRPEMRLVLRIASSAVPAGGNDSDRNFTLPETLEEPTVINILWSDFKTADWVTIDKIVPLVTTVKHLLGIKFEYSLWAFDGDDDNDNDPENMIIRFNLQKIGAYGTCED